MDCSPPESVVVTSEKTSGVDRPPSLPSPNPTFAGSFSETRSDLDSADFGGSFVGEDGARVRRKRGREEREGEGKAVEKRAAEEGMSWWTCLMLGVGHERTKPQAVTKKHLLLTMATNSSDITDTEEQEWDTVQVPDRTGKDEEEEDDWSQLPEPPEEPLATDCCGTGCSPCVRDIYEEELQEWQRVKAMTPEERTEWRRKKLGGKERESGATPVGVSPAEYRRFPIASIKHLTKNSYLFTFSLPPAHTLGLQVGQHIVLRVQESHGGFLSRQYTPVSPLNQRGTFDVAIKVYESGRVSQHIGQWQVGSMADWRGPFGGFDYHPNKYSHIGMLACGTGLAPMIQVIRAVVENEDEDTVIHLLYGCRTQHDILLKDQLDHFSSYWNFTVLYALSKSSGSSLAEDQGQVKYGDKVHFGRIDRSLVATEMPACNVGTVVLICGTKSFDKDMINHLSRAGYPREMYFKF